MQRWVGKACIVTGSSSGIGAACSVEFVKAGMKVAALARREDRLNELKNSLPENLRKNFYPIKCDVTDEADVIRAFRWVDEHLGGVHVLINNAGIARKSNLVDKESTADIKAVVDTNIMGVVYCVREAYQQMVKNKVDGHVVIVNSMSGHRVAFIPGTSFNIYATTKHAVTAMTETYSVSPGAVETEFLAEEFKGKIPFLKAENISNAILYCVSTPPHVQIQELMIKPLHQKY